MEITKLRPHLIMASQHFHNNSSGLTGPTGVRASLNVDLVHLEHVLEFVTEEMNSVSEKKNKPKPVRTYHLVTLTNMNVFRMIKDRVHRTQDNYPRLFWRHSENPDKEQNGGQLFSNIGQMVVSQWTRRNVLK